MKAWPGDLRVGKLGDLQAMFSSVTGEFTFHIGILGLSEVCAASWGKFTFLFVFWVWVKFVHFLKFYIAKLNPSSSLKVYLKTVYQYMNLDNLFTKLDQAKCVH